MAPRTGSTSIPQSGLPTYAGLTALVVHSATVVGSGVELFRTVCSAVIKSGAKLTPD